MPDLTGARDEGFSPVCDSCLTAAYDEGFATLDEQEEVCLDHGYLLDDHVCDSFDEPDIRCDCAAHSRKGR